MESVSLQETQLDEPTVEVVATVEESIAAEKKAKPALKKKAKKVYEAVRVMNCDRCGQATVHTLFNYETKVYKCNICGSFHTKRN